MRVAAVAVVGYLLVGLELGLSESLRLGSTAIGPSLTLGFAVFIALSAAPVATLWTAFLLGLTMDLLSPHVLGELPGASPTTIIGPHALGFTLGAYIVLLVRTTMIRRNPLTVGVLTIVAGIAVAILSAVILGLQSLFADLPGVRPGRLLLEGLGAAAYSGVAGALLAIVLIPMMPLFNLADPAGRRFTRRA